MSRAIERGMVCLAALVPACGEVDGAGDTDVDVAAVLFRRLRLRPAEEDIWNAHKW